jgi:type VII secretion integral membrane protein EccD
MSTVAGADLCRITVVGPDRRADLAVPVTSTVAALMPVLLHHTENPLAAQTRGPGNGWVLQRLGEPPFEPTGTPETLSWLQGEELHLRPAEDPLPELDFDDLAEGISTMVNRRRDRWQPEYRKPLFLALTLLALLLVGVVLARSTPVVYAVSGLSLSLVLSVAALLVARMLEERQLSALLAGAGCLFAGFTAWNLADGAATTIRIDAFALMIGAATAALVALLLFVAQWLWAPALPYPVLVAILVTAIATILVPWMRMVFGMDAPAAAGCCAVVLFLVVVLAPKAALRAAALRGPQLPKTGEELQFDIAPQTAEVMHRRTNDADNFLSVVVVSVSLVQVFLWRILVEAPGWPGPSLVAALTVALLLRARNSMGVWPRLSLTAAGCAGLVMLIMRFVMSLPLGWLIALVVLLVAGTVMLSLSALRPPPRRLLPIWEFMATVGDVVTGIALIPIVLQLLHLYAYARGFFG